ncbi:25394_t:CDS:1, partial [Racocetra persica]
LAELEEIRDTKLFQLFADFQAHCRGWLARKDHAKRNERLRAALIIQKNIRALNSLKANPWWKLFLKIRPTLNCTKVEELQRQIRLRDDKIRELEEKLLQESEAKKKLESLNSQL